MAADSTPSKKTVAAKGAKTVAAKGAKVAVMPTKVVAKGAKVAVKPSTATPSKKTVATKSAKVAVKHPRPTGRAVKTAFKVAKPIAKRQALKQVDRVVVGTGTTVELLTIYGPIVALALGLAEPPKRRSVVPPLAAGALIGATTVYFFGPKRPAR